MPSDDDPQMRKLLPPGFTPAGAATLAVVIRSRRGPLLAPPVPGIPPVPVVPPPPVVLPGPVVPLAPPAPVAADVVDPVVVAPLVVVPDAVLPAVVVPLVVVPEVPVFVVVPDPEA